MVKIIEILAIEGSNARPGHELIPKYITIHNTANTTKGADADNHARYLQTGAKDGTVSYHYCVDDGQIVRIIPDNENAWHAGDGKDGTGNRQSLSIEICENVDGDLKKATDNAVELTAMLAKKYNIPLKNIVQHNYWNKKDCPRRLRKGEPYTWEEFLKKVDTILNPPAPQQKTYGEAGDKIILKNANLYAASSSAKPSGSPRSGVYYIWSNEVVNGRIRVTVKKDWAGVAKKVTGWVNIAQAPIEATPVVVTPKPSVVAPKPEPYVQGRQITLVNDKLYTASSGKIARVKTGTYYIYDGKKINGRYRVTNKKSNCGKKPLVMYVSGWIEV